MIDEDLYIQIYTNIRNGTTGLTLVLHGQRIYGRDSEDWKWHRHPFENPDVHDFSEEGSRKVTLDEREACSSNQTLASDADVRRVARNYSASTRIFNTCQRTGAHFSP